MAVLGESVTALGGWDDDLQCATDVDYRTGEHLIRTIREVAQPDEPPTIGESSQFTTDRLTHEPAYLG